MLKDLFIHIIKALLIALLYFEITNANDTTLENISLFIILYIMMIYTTILLDIDSNIITTAFLTKAVFTLIDERIKRKKN